MDKVLKLIRYNTGNDKKIFIEFKDNFDAVIFNATIVAYSGSAISDLVSVYKNQYIIDPMTHIFQHDISAIQAVDKAGNIIIKKSVEKYVEQLPQSLRKILLESRRPLNTEDIKGQINKLVASVYSFETEYVNSFLDKKDYNKYLEFVKLGPHPRLVIAPYFMLKDAYDYRTINAWLDINNKCLNSFINKNAGAYSVAAQLVVDKDVLYFDRIIDKFKNTYSVEGYEYIFVWIDNFNSFDANDKLRQKFYELIKLFNGIGKKVIMAYGGYDSILLCNKNIPCRLYGVAQSVGYGEAREITPVGGGIPGNKYYFFPTHQRLKFSEAAAILTKAGYFSQKKSTLEYANDYYTNICNCKQCKKIIKKNIDNFNDYNDSIPFTIKGKYGPISRNRPTTNASLISAMHFMHCKVREWEDVSIKSFITLSQEIINNHNKYSPNRTQRIDSWCKLYEK